MTAKSVLLVLLALAVAPLAPAAEFPLKMRKLTAEEAWICHGGASPPVVSTEILNTERPAAITREPQATSRYPLYGMLRVIPKSPIAFRLDESKGTGKGYDRFIADLNGNGDLRDDAVAKGSRKTIPYAAGAWSTCEIAVFDAIEIPLDGKGRSWRPIAYPVMYLHAHHRQRLGRIHGPLSADRDSAVILNPGFYLEATVDLDGARETIGLLDGGRDLRLGDKARVRKAGTASGFRFLLEEMFSDRVLRDRDGSGAFEFDVCQSESEPLSDLICLGRNVYRLAIAEDLTSIRLEPTALALGEVIVADQPDKVRTLTLVRERPTGGFEFLTPALADGRAMVPVGTYYLYSCVVAAKDRRGLTAVSRGEMRDSPSPITVTAGKAVALRCGAPIELRVHAQKMVRLGSSLRISDALATSEAGTFAVAVTVQVVGTGGESYALHAKGEDLTVPAPPPRFRILDEAGEEIATGQLEYG